MPVLAELKRRNVFKVAAAYAVVAWLLLQIADVLLPALQLPAWTITLVAVLLVLGFPIALVLAWAYDIGPGGVQRTEAAAASDDQPRGPSRTVDFAIIGVLSVALAFVVFNYVLVDETPTPETDLDAASVAPAPVETVPTTTEAAQDVLPNSVAVLPLDNLSPNPDDAYFAAGTHEEILNHLAQLQNLNVISRTSVMRYAESDLSAPEIASELNVGAIMEGSVRFAGERVRVTLQLIDARTDVHLWSETYDDTLSDIFAIQADIAMNVANALQAEFSLEEQQSIEKRPTTSDAAYMLYLRAIDTPWRGAGPVADLDSAIELDPEFAEAYAFKAYYTAYTAPPSDETEASIVENAETALSLDPTLGLAHLALGVLYESRWRAAEALAELTQARELDPNDPETLQQFARFNRYIGNYSEAVPAIRRAVQLDPNTRVRHSQLGASLRHVDDFEGAIAAYNRATELAPSFVGNYTQLAQVYAASGRAEEALTTLALAEALETSNTVRLAQMAATYARIGRPDDARRAFEHVEAIARNRPQSDALWAVAYLAIGDLDEAAARLSNAIDVQIPSGSFSYGETRIPFSNIKGNVWGLPVLEEPRFVELRDRIFALN